MGESIKVVHLIESLGRGGAEQSLLNVVPALREAGVASRVLVLDGSTATRRELAPAFRSQGIAVDFFHSTSYGQKARELQQRLQRQPVDVLQAHLTRSVMVAGWPFSRQAPGQPVKIGSLHNLGYEKPVPISARPRHWLKKALARRAAGTFQHWHAVSAAVKNHYCQHWQLPPAAVTVIPNPVSVPLPLPHQTLETTPAAAAPLIVLPGRLVPEKGHDFAIGLARQLRREYPGLRWLFAGGGPLLDALQARIQAEGLSEVIGITGEISHADMLQRLAEATLVIQPSRQEGFGMTAAEAMALGKPVLASDAGGLPETLGEAGRVVPLANESGWLSTVRYLLDSPVARATLGTAAKARVQARFSPQAISQQWLGLYQRLLQRPAQPMIQATASSGKQETPAA